MSTPPICRLCITASKDSKSLYDEQSRQPNDLYKMIFEYFHPKIVDLEKAKHLIVICSQCFRCIDDFHNFQSVVMMAQLKLVEENKTISETEAQEFPNSPMAIKMEEEDVMEKLVDKPKTHETIELSSLQDEQLHKAHLDEFENRNISLPKLEIIDVETDTVFTSDDEVPLAAVAAKTKRRTTTTHNYAKLDDLLAKWIPNINCIKCPLSFPTLSLVREHFTYRHPTDEFYITCCSRQFKARYQIRDHLLLHDDPDIFTCDLCANTYTTRCGLKYHKANTHRLNIKFTCDLCGKDSNTENDLASHYREMHNSDRPDRAKLLLLADGRTAYICRQCGETEYSLAAFKAHRSLEHDVGSKKNDENSKDQNEVYSKSRAKEVTMDGNLNSGSPPNEYGDYRRDSIPSTSKDAAHLHVGTKVHKALDGETEQNYLTSEAGVHQEADNTNKYISQPELDIMDVNPDSETRSADEMTLGDYPTAKGQSSETCNTSEVGVSSTGQPNKDERRLDILVAKWMPKLKCSACPESFFKWRQFQKHFKHMHPNKVFYVSCCSRQFKTRDTLRDHLLLHGNPDVHKCDICGNTYASTQSITRHKTEVHPENLTFVCSTCGKGFLTKQGLTIHNREMHTSGRPYRPKVNLLQDGSTTYTCQLCGATKDSYAEFRIHWSDKHVKISQFVCTVCGTAFNSSRVLREHEAIHANKDLYKCAFCPETFRKLQSLIVHRNKKHPHKRKRNYYINEVDTPTMDDYDSSTKSPNEEDNIPSTSKGAAAGGKKVPISEDDFEPNAEPMQTYLIYDYGVTQEYDENVSSNFQETTELVDCGKDSIPSTSMGAVANAKKVPISKEDFKPDPEIVQNVLISDYGFFQEVDQNVSSKFQKKTEPELEILDINPDSETDSEDEIPLAQRLTAKRQSNEKHHNASSDQLKQDDTPNKRTENLGERRLCYLLAQWMPIIKCTACTETFPKWFSLHKHFKQMHPNVEFYVSCCSRQFKTRDKIRDHLLTHADPDVLKCNICGVTYSSTQKLLMHKSEVHPESHKFVCKACNKGFNTMNGLTVHDRKMHNTALPDRLDRPKIYLLPDGRTAYTCQLCGVTTNSYVAFRTHRSLKHLKITKFVCTVCGRACRGPRNLREHEASHQKKKLYKCAFCHKRFSLTRSIIQHRKKVHPLESDKHFYINIDDNSKDHNEVNTSTTSANVASNDEEDDEMDSIPSTWKVATADQQVNDDNISEEDSEPDAEGIEEDEDLAEIELLVIKTDSETVSEDEIPLAK